MCLVSIVGKYCIKIHCTGAVSTVQRFKVEEIMDLKAFAYYVRSSTFPALFNYSTFSHLDTRTGRR